MRNIHFLVIALVAFVPIAFFTTYGIAVGLGHVEAGFPYISDTGTTPPESCIFGQFLDIGAVAFAIIMYIRYYHVDYCIESETVNALLHLNKGKLKKLNKAAFIIGISSSFGVTVVGNFQETNVLYVHLIGALLAFFNLHIYCWLQTVISYKLSLKLYSTNRIVFLRMMFCLLGLVNLILLGIFSVIAKGKFDGKNPLIWKPTDNGFDEHVISTANEWSLSIISMLHLLTFVPDFKKITLTPPKIIEETIIPTSFDPTIINTDGKF